MPDRYLVQCARVLLCTALLLSSAAQAQTGVWYKVELIVFSHPTGSAAEQWEALPRLAYPKVTRFLVQPGPESSTGATVAPAPTAPLAAFTLLGASQRELAGKADAMKRSGRYQILFHEAWLQPIEAQAGAIPIVLDRSGDGGPWPALQGTIKFYLSNDLYLDTNLWLNTQGEYLHGTWRMPAPPLAPPSDPQQSWPGMSQSAAPVTSAVTQPNYPYRHAVLLQQTHRLRNGHLHYIDHPLLGVLVAITALNGAEFPLSAQPGTMAPAPGEAKRAPAT